DNSQAIGKLGYFYIHAASLDEMNWRIKARSLGRISSRSGKSITRFSPSGMSGARPMARVTASPNLAGWAVERITVGAADEAMRAAALAATAVCGSMTWPVSANTALMAARVAASSLAKAL